MMMTKRLFLSGMKFVSDLSPHQDQRSPFQDCVISARNRTLLQPCPGLPDLASGAAHATWWRQRIDENGGGQLMSGDTRTNEMAPSVTLPVGVHLDEALARPRLASRSLPLRVFVSYKLRDFDAANQIGQLLRRIGGNNIDVFVAGDSESIRPATDFRAQILKKLCEAHVVIFFQPDPNLQWDWCLYETGYFDGLHEPDATAATATARSAQDAVAPGAGGAGPRCSSDGGRPRCARIFRMTAGSCSVAISRSRPPQCGHARTSTANARCISTAQLQARGGLFSRVLSGPAAGDPAEAVGRGRTRP